MDRRDHRHGQLGCVYSMDIECWKKMKMQRLNKEATGKIYNEDKFNLFLCRNSASTNKN